MDLEKEKESLSFIEREKDSISFIEKKSSKALCPLKHETKIDHIKKLTHLYFNDAKLKEIGDLIASENLQVLYLQNNEITKITNLDTAVFLTHLYLQRNSISKIENLSRQKLLRRLYLGYNRISVIEGLEHCTNLEELHVEKQMLGPGEALCFDPRSIFTLSDCLKVLNISGNNITTVTDLAPLRHLTTIICSNNKIEDLDDICQTVWYWKGLREATFAGNPAASNRRYREKLIACTERMETLDGKNISDLSRRFIRGLEAEKFFKSKFAASVNISKKPYDIKSGASPVIEKAVMKSIAQAPSKSSFSKSIITTQLAEPSEEKYLPWRAMKAENRATIPPLFRKQNITIKNKQALTSFRGSIFPKMP